MTVKVRSDVITLIRVNDGAKGETGKSGIDLSNGKILFTDPYFASGTNSVHIYNNFNNGSLTVERVAKSSDNPFPNTSYELKITNTGTSTPGCGGFDWANQSRANAVFIYRIIAKFPTGRRIYFTSNATGSDTEREWLTSNAGTGKFTEYIYKLTCGSAGHFSTTGYFYLDGALGTVSSPVEWRVAYATCFDMTNESDANQARNIANGKNKVVFSATANPSGTSGYSAGDIWFNKSTGGIWQFDGSKWNPHQVGTPSIANGAITADKVAANAINAQKINVDALSAISANLGNVTAGNIKGVTINGSEIKTHWAKVSVGDYAEAVGAYYARVRLYKNQFLIESYQGYGNEVPTDDTFPDGVISLYGAASWDTDNIIIGYAAKSASGGITDDAIDNILTNDEVDTDYLISKKMLGTMVYRVGTIYMSTEDYSPAGFFGGTWEQIKDRFLLSAGDSYHAGSTGGQTNMHIINSGAEASGYGLVYGGNGFAGRVMVTDGNYTSDSNLPPYLTVYMWKRIA